MKSQLGLGKISILLSAYFVISGCEAINPTATLGKISKAAKEAFDSADKQSSQTDEKEKPKAKTAKEVKVEGNGIDSSLVIAAPDGPPGRDDVLSLSSDSPGGQGGVCAYKDSSGSKLLVTAEVWDARTKEIATLKARIMSLEGRITDEVEKAKLEASEKARTDAEAELERQAGDALRSAERRIEEVSLALAAYSYDYAVVNGVCAMTLRDDSEWLYSAEDVCVQVTTKKVGARGTITAIENARSPKLSRIGIVSITCEVGRANIRIQKESCFNKDQAAKVKPASSELPSLPSADPSRDDGRR